MKLTTVEYLEAVKARHSVTSDYALAKLLGISQSRLGHYRKRGSTMDNTMAAKVAELLAKSPLHVIADVEIERAGAARPEVAKFWARYAAELAGAAVVITAALPAVVHPGSILCKIARPPKYPRPGPFPAGRRSRTPHVPPELLARQAAHQVAA